jgi:hypothetical protein
MSFPMCETCGTQYDLGGDLPTQCPICNDERQYVGWAGQRWITIEDLATTHKVRVEDDGGLPGIGILPAFAIDQRALLLQTQRRRILWECVSLVTPAAVAAIRARGGVDAIVISHPHFYSAMVEWSDALGGVPIVLHEADQDWIGRRSRHIELWEGDEHELCEGVTLLRCGGHFPGSTGLHWKDERRPAGAFFPGDALQVVLDRKHVTFMYSYPNYIPLHPDVVRGMQRRVQGYEFSDIYGYTWGRNILGGARAAVDRSFDRYLLAVGAVHA